MNTIEVKGLAEFIAKLKGLGSGRLANYAARALNDVAAEAQRAMIAETTSKLTTRGSWFKTGSRFGYNRQPANKSNLEARVFTRAPWMQEQENVTFKTARKSFLTLPSTAIRSGRSDPKKVPPRFYPSRMGPKLFKIQTKKGPVLAQRLRRAGLRIMYFLERTIHFPKRVRLLDTATKAVNLHAPSALEKQIANAIREQGLK
jgi:hypothetical protein